MLLFPQIPPRAPRRARVRALAAAIGLMLARTAAAADAPGPGASQPGLALRPSATLAEKLPASVQALEPVFVDAGQLRLQPYIRLDASGAVQLRRHSVVFKADALHDDLVTNEIDAHGNVRVLRDGNLFSGPSLKFNLDSSTGTMPDAHYFFNRTQGGGQAAAVQFLGRQHLQAEQATYTTCTESPADWVLQAAHLDLDFASDTGVAEDGGVKFKGVTILPLPYASFPLTTARKSGLLPPTIGLDSRNGLDWAQPYYWNIAPNYDATITPRLLLRRGLMGSASVRWLQPSYSGNAIVDYLPEDRSNDGQSRWAAVFQQSGGLTSNLSYGLNLQRVSDNNWWQDFGSVDPVIAGNRTLPQQGQITWSQPNGMLQASFNTWQTLQSTVSPVAVPYDVQHQLLGSWHSLNVTGLQWQLDAATARFSNSTPTLLSGDRSYVDPTLSLPFVAPQGFVTPALHLYAATYTTDSPMANGSTSASRTVPSFSLDSGLVFERATHAFGHELTQTLEPRLYYVYTPYRAQQYLPNFDSAALDLNLATIYTDNLFSGNDRIADANNITAGATTRWLDASSGAEYASLTAAQRVLLSPQRVTLTGTPVPKGLSDTFLLGSLSVTPNWSANAGIDYNMGLRELAQASFGAQWHVGDFKNLSLSYLTQSATATQIPLRYVNGAWQWRLSSRWYSVGQADYSLQDRSLNNGLFGFEYDGGCWVGRIVLQRQSLTAISSTTRILFQLELSGFSRLGNNPLGALQQNIPGYQLVHQPTAVPSRYVNYE